MATKQIKKLSDLQKITTATGDQMIPVVDASGNVNPIKLTDLAQVVAGLMPVATESSKGLMSANDKKYGIQFINLPKNSARKIIQINNAYSQFIVIGFLVCGPFPINFIFSGRSETNNTIYNYHYEKINIHNYFNLYKKENCFYIENKSPNDGCTGFLISTQTIGTENINIDDSFTLLE